MTINLEKVEETRDGRILVTWGDGSSTQFLGRQEIETRLERDRAMDQQFTENLLLHSLLEKINEGTRYEQIAAGEAILDRSAPEPVKFTSRGNIQPIEEVRIDGI